MRRARLAHLLLGAAVTACSAPRTERVAAAPEAAPTPTVPADAAPPPTLDASSAMSTDPVRVALPAALADRLGELVRAPLPADIVLSFADIGRTKDPVGNVRWQLAGDGRLFVDRHAGRDRAVAFDQPWPATPTAILPATEVAALRAAVTEAGLYDHPGYETVAATGGDLFIIRARRDGGDPHTVVLVNVRSPFIDRLRAVASGR